MALTDLVCGCDRYFLNVALDEPCARPVTREQKLIEITERLIASTEWTVEILRAYQVNVGEAGLVRRAAMRIMTDHFVPTADIADFFNTSIGAVNYAVYANRREPGLFSR